MQHDPNEIPYGFCHCGCGRKTTLAIKTSRHHGLRAGEPTRFITGHNNRIEGGIHNRRWQETFWARVDRSGPNGCWLWMGVRNASGYGDVKAGGERTHRAHRVAYEITIGPIPDGLVIDHLCRNKSCVNPAHLEPVTTRENTLRGLRGRLTTHCPQGHPLSGDNLARYSKSGRVCRTCKIAYSRRLRKRKADAARHCDGITAKGTRCTKRASVVDGQHGWCYQHGPDRQA